MSTISQIALKTRIDSRLSSARNLPEFKYVMLEAVRELGFSDFVLSPVAEGSEIDFTLSSLPADLIEYYTEFELHKYDMMLEYIVANTDPLFQKAIDDFIEHTPFKTERILHNEDLCRLAAEFCYYDSLVIPLPGSSASQRKVHKTIDERSGMAKGQRCNEKEEKGFFAVLCKGKNSVEFQCAAKNFFTELNVLANSFYTFGANKFPNFFSHIVHAGPSMPV